MIEENLYVQSSEEETNTNMSDGYELRNKHFRKAYSGRLNIEISGKMREKNLLRKKKERKRIDKL